MKGSGHTNGLLHRELPKPSKELVGVKTHDELLRLLLVRRPIFFFNEILLNPSIFLYSTPRSLAYPGKRPYQLVPRNTCEYIDRLSESWPVESPMCYLLPWTVSIRRALQMSFAAGSSRCSPWFPVRKRNSQPLPTSHVQPCWVV